MMEKKTFQDIFFCGLFAIGIILFFSSGMTINYNGDASSVTFGIPVIIFTIMMFAVSGYYFKVRK